MFVQELIDKASRLRSILEPNFSCSTAAPGTCTDGVPSSGHCAAVAIIVQRKLGGEFVSTRVNGVSHWFNRINNIDVDLTGDQFGFSSVRVGIAGSLFPNTRIRDETELTSETRARAKNLAAKSLLDL